jgi:hypothetical protein
MDDRMLRRGPWFPWAVTSVILVLVALGAYSVGAHREAAAAGADPAVHAWHYYPFPGIWTLFILFWVFGGLRWMWWGGCYRPWRYRRYDYPTWHDTERSDWEEWHRREHERMNTTRGPEGSSRSEASRGPV